MKKAILLILYYSLLSNKNLSPLTIIKNTINTKANPQYHNVNNNPNIEPIIIPSKSFKSLLILLYLLFITIPYNFQSC